MSIGNLFSREETAGFFAPELVGPAFALASSPSHSAYWFSPKPVWTLGVVMMAFSLYVLVEGAS